MPSVSSIEEAAQLLAAAHEQGRPVRIGTDLTTEGLDTVLEHETGDLTCTVEAGVRLSALDAALSAAGQRLSLDPPGDPTVGALLADNVSGPLRHRFGAPRDLVLGVTVVLADGTVASAGGKVVKNVAGYDLARLVCGSRGRLALIVRASFRLHPLPKAARTLVVETDDAASAVAALVRSHLQPSALDVLHPGRVAVLVEGSERAVTAQIRAARDLVGGDEAEPAVWDESRRRQAESEARIRFAPRDLARLLAEVPEAIVRPAAGVAYVARTPSYNLSHAQPGAADQAAGASYNLSQGDSAAALAALLRRIERELDPRGVLSGGPA